MATITHYDVFVKKNQIAQLPECPYGQRPIYDPPGYPAAAATRQYQ
jgi:hypothetical protein